MTLRRRIAFVFWLVVALPPLAMASRVRGWETFLIVWVAACLLTARWTWPWIGRAVTWRAQHRFQTALEREDAAGARRVVQQLALSEMPAFGEFMEGCVLLMEERWDEAIALYEQLSDRELPRILDAGIDNNLAWALAHAGQADSAVELAKGAVDGANDRLRPAALGTLGAALVLCGKPSEAVGALEKAIALRGTDSRRGTLHYYLGEALTALGRHDEAIAAYRTAADLPNRFGRRARDRLARGVPPAYR